MRANLAFAGAFALSCVVTAGTAFAQITIDGTLSPARSLTGPSYAITADLGRQVGANLFHSFGQFNLNTGETATFSGPTSVANVIARVTGGNASSINGTIASTIPGANLFLLNPAGLMFGPDASVNISGSFHATTADYLRFADGAMFSATTPSGSTLTTAAPAAFGFLSSNPAAISVNGSTLSVPTGQQLSLVGGTVTITDASVSAPSGVIAIASVASAGEAAFTAGQPSPSLDVSSFSSLGTASIISSTVATEGNPGGTVLIRAGNVIVAGGAGNTISVVNSDTTGSANGVPTAIDILASNALTLQSGYLDADGDGSGNAGDITVNAGSISLSIAAGSRYVSRIGSAANNGEGGNIFIDAQTSVSVDNSRIEAPVFGTGNGGNITLDTGTLSITSEVTDSYIGTVSNGQGNSGNLTVNATGITLVGGSGGFTGLTVQSNPPTTTSSASAGTLTINAASLQILNGAEVDASLYQGNGSGGHIYIDAGNLVVSGADPYGDLSGIYANAVDGFDTHGNSGDINITANSVALTNGGEITTYSEAVGNAGPITLTTGSLTVSGGSFISSTNFGFGSAGAITVSAGHITLAGPQPIGDFTGIFSLSGVGATAAGPISITANNLTITGGAVVSAETFGLGAGGSVNIVAGTIEISGNDPANNYRSGVLSEAVIEPGFGAYATGNAGSVTIQAGELSLDDDALISVAANGHGNAGAVTLNVGSLDVEGGAEISSDTVLDGQGGNVNITASSIRVAGTEGAANPSAISSSTEGAGAGGEILLNAAEVTIADGGKILATGTSTGNSGDVVITAADGLSLDSGVITTSAAEADGGNITIDVGNLLWLGDSQINSAVKSGVGSGGNIMIDPLAVVLVGSTISADAFGGSGGNITIDASVLISTEGSSITASSALGISGTITVTAPSDDVTIGLAELAGKLIAPPDIARTACADVVRREKSSRLAAEGRGGLAPDAAEPLSVSLLAGAPIAPQSGSSDEGRVDVAVQHVDLACR